MTARFAKRAPVILAPVASLTPQLPGERASVFRSALMRTPGRRMKLAAVASLCVTSLLSACATQERGFRIAPSLELTAPRGIRMGRPDVSQEKAGVRVHGSVCRMLPTRAPTRIRVERVSEEGGVESSTSRQIVGLYGRREGCAFYSIQTDWVLRESESLRVCSLMVEAACTTATR